MTSKTATATLSNYRQAPRKVRLVANLIRGKEVPAALRELTALPRRAAPAFTKLIASAVANAKANGIEEKGLIVQTLFVNKGPVMKRMMPRAHGRGFPIHKHTSHITVTLSGVSVTSTKGDKSGESKEKTVVAKLGTTKTKKEVTPKAKSKDTAKKPSTKSAK